MIKLSIIIPHYNSVEGLFRLLKTIPSSKDIEIIVVDDRSTIEINSLQTLITENKGNTQSITLLSNTNGKKGAGTCRNIGIKEARGKWILFADADDYFTESAFNIINKYIELDYDVVYFTPTSIEIETGDPTDRHIHYKSIIQQYLEKPVRSNQIKLLYMFYVPWSKLIKRKILIEKNIYFDEVMASNDVMFSTRLGKVIKDFLASSEIIYCVTKSKGSLTMNLKKEVFYDRFYVFVNYYKFLQRNLSSDEFKQMKLSGRGQIISALKYKIGLKETISIIIYLIKNRVKLLEPSVFNPIKLLKKVVYLYKRYKTQKKYFIS